MSSTATTSLNALIVLAVLALMISRQMRARPLKPPALVIVPALMVYAGARAPGASAVDVTLVAGLAGEVALGVVRGFSMRVWRDAEGRAWRQGTRYTLAWWLVGLVARIGLVMVEHAGSGQPARTAWLWYGFAGTLAGQYAALAWRVAAGTRNRSLTVRG
ncbi:MAG: hypothetical protein ACJ73S_24945 [Mycobacteriales bacterium]|jgi:hypothetical protein